MPDAPYTGGTSPGGRIFAVDGDFTVAWPCAAPEIYCPFQGDSNPSFFPIVLLDRSIDPPAFVSLPVGTGFNQQPFNANQTAIVIEQEFMVWEGAQYQLPLNTPYNVAWSVGWGNSYQNLENCFLVEEGPLTPVGGGIAVFKRKFASLPGNRNDPESYAATFPMITDGTNPRFGFSEIVNSRIFREFFVYDDLNLLTSIPLYPEGHRISTSEPTSLPVMWEQFRGFKAATDAVKNYNYLDPDTPIADDDGSGSATTPDYTTYKSWQQNQEIVAESSSFERYMGNIYVRKTRFVLAK